jgi:uncharacterized protein (TIGR02145 family)
LIDLINFENKLEKILKSFLILGLLASTFLSCTKKTSPKIYTQTPTEIYSDSAVVNSSITQNGNFVIASRGVVWSIFPSPDIYNYTGITEDGFGIGGFESHLNGLLPTTTYYVKAYAILNSGVAVYGNEVSFTTTASTNGSGILNPNYIYGSVTDQEGNSYATIVIGGQEWMAQNLSVTKYQNGDPIPNVTAETEWANLTTGAWVYYENNSFNDSIYGKLYNWYAVTDSRNVCPIGWHVPSDEEWTQLTNLLGGDLVAGGKMKSTSSLWAFPNTGASNLSGLSLLPGGARYSNGFGYMGTFGDWWSTTEYDFGTSLDRNLSYVSESADRYARNKTDGFSVRCVKN